MTGEFPLNSRRKTVKDAVMPRTATLTRTTKETDIVLELDLDGTGKSEVATGIPFFDHMLELFARHSLFDLRLRATGDLAVDYHHTVEDTGIVLGQALLEALGEKRGIVRYGHAYVPMDEVLARVVVDFSGRPCFVYSGPTGLAAVRDFGFHLVPEFLRAFASSGRMNLHAAVLVGEEPHHVAEALFKALARACDAACRLDSRRSDVPSTKGVL